MNIKNSPQTFNNSLTELPAYMKDLSLTPEDLSSFFVLIAKPKPRFFAWIEETLDVEFQGQLKANQVYFPEEDCAWLIPKGFESSEGYMDFVQLLKPIILYKQFRELWVPGASFPSEITADTFDEFFELELRENVVNSLDFFSRPDNDQPVVYPYIDTESMRFEGIFSKLLRIVGLKK